MPRDRPFAYHPMIVLVALGVIVYALIQLARTSELPPAPDGAVRGANGSDIVTPLPGHPDEWAGGWEDGR